MSGLRVWLDDDLVDRAAPDGWVHAVTAWAAIELLDGGEVVELSLDGWAGSTATRSSMTARVWPTASCTTTNAPTTGTAFTQRALDFFAEHGIVAERLMTDNAFSSVKNRSLRELLARRAINRLRTRPYTPRTNGKVERYQQTLQREWAYALEYSSSQARRASLVHTGCATTTSSAPTAPAATELPSRVREVTGHNS